MRFPFPRSVAASAPLILAAAFFGSCGHGSPPATNPEAPEPDSLHSTELSRVQFHDLPVPEGFSYRIRGNPSFSYDRGGVRVGKFVYWGTTPVNDVVEFYRKTMPLRAFDWQFVKEEVESSGRTVLDFRKGHQTCLVDIGREPGGTTTITVQIAGAS